MVIIDENSDDDEDEEVGSAEFQEYRGNIFSDGVFEKAPDIEETQQEQYRFNPGLPMDKMDDLIIDHGDLEFTLSNQQVMQPELEAELTNLKASARYKKQSVQSNEPN